MFQILSVFGFPRQHVSTIQNVGIEVSWLCNALSSFYLRTVFKGWSNLAHCSQNLGLELDPSAVCLQCFGPEEPCLLTRDSDLRNVKMPVHIAHHLLQLDVAKDVAT